MRIVIGGTEDLTKVLIRRVCVTRGLRLSKEVESVRRGGGGGEESECRSGGSGSVGHCVVNVRDERSGVAGAFAIGQSETADIEPIS